MQETITEDSNLKLWPQWKQEFRKLTSLSQDDIPDTFGVYIITADKALMRLVGKDERGILTIGESIDLRKRITMFLDCALGNRRRGHTAGWRYHELGIDKEFPLESLFVSWQTAQNKEEAYVLEGLNLGFYLQRHFEQPPLNYKSNGTASQVYL